MKHKFVILPLFLFTLAFLGVWQSSDLYRQSAAAYFNQANLGSDDFRRMQPGSYVMEQLRGDAEQTGLSPGELLAIRLPFEHFSFGSGRAWTAARYEAWRMLFFQKNRSGYERVCQAYAAVWDDVRYFPVSAPGVCYENSWMFERTYGGLRGHEGTDLMPPENIAGYYPVVSMTDGVVEKIGWLPKGGWRIGIRSPSGGYFYYAHLDSYSRSYGVGDRISAGEVLGTMGDTGYGGEGTRGKFAVHLHLGIYIHTEEYEELSVNPYWVLRWAEKMRER